MARGVHPTHASAAPFVIATSLAAFLLFDLELLAARLLLPVFGGAPAVWTTCLCFFTAILFLGYGYAHWVATRLSTRTGGLIQLALSAVAIAAMVAAPADVASLRHAGLPPTLGVLGALLVLAGPAALVLGSTTPLLSSWYAAGRAAPWWLYAVSNGASFAALLAYPFAIAPAIPLSVQRTLATLALAAYALVVAWVALRGSHVRAAALEPGTSADRPASYARRASWLLAAAAPAGLMAATTNFIQTDLVAAPLIWIGPLGVYLASFVVAFSRVGSRALPVAERLVPAAATLLWLPFFTGGWPVVPLLSTELAALFVIAFVVHGRLAADRPGDAHLTRFYLVIALGGLLGTAMVALVAPNVFSRVYEYPVLVAASTITLALLPGRILGPGFRVTSNPARALVELLARAAPYALAAALLYVAIPPANDVIAAALSKPVLVFLGSAVVVLAATSQMTALLTAVVLSFLSSFAARSPLLIERSFFGVTQVVGDGRAHLEFSGTTLHGLQFGDLRSAEPTTYYVEDGPLGAIFDDLRGRTAGAAVGVVGLGSGTIAAYSRGGDRFTFFEIDPAVIAVATDPKCFTYVKNAAAKPRIVAGDGRLSLDREPPGSFDLIVLDAFTSDVVPAHLLTREAMEMYVSKLRGGGLLAFHVSSRFYSLADAVGATARSLGLAAARLSFDPDWASSDRLGATRSTWVVVGRAKEVAGFTARGWTPVPASRPVLTDDHSDLTRLLIWRPQDRTAAFEVVE